MPQWLHISRPFSRDSSPQAVDVSGGGQSTVSEEREGLFLLAPLEEDGKAINVDVVAVHGLQGHYRKTWTEGGKIWLQDFLPHALPAARIMSFGYNSTVIATKSIAGIDEFARQLLEGLEQKRRGGAEERPIVFVCHSLGGVVVKKALFIAHAESPKFYQTIIENVKGVVFMGVPHRGAVIADLGSFFASIIKATTAGRVTNSALLKTLKKGSKPLQEISEMAVQRLSNLQICSFYETERLKGQLVVDKDSVRLNFGNERVIPVAANHANICKFSSAESEKYKLVQGAITQLVETFAPIKSIPQVKLTKHERECLLSLYDEDPNAAKELFPSRVPNTCGWIWEDSLFQKWLSSNETNLIWVSGPPGCGKTMISSFLVDDLRSKRPSSTVCFYFSDDKDVEHNTAEALLRGILYQLLDAKRFLVKHALRYFEKAGERALKELNVLWKICRHCFEDADIGNLVIILDALDECQESGRDHLLGWLKKFTSQRPEGSVKFLLTSRPEIGIEDIINDLSLQLQLEQSHAEHIATDIERVISFEIKQMPALKNWSDERKNQLRHHLLKKSGKTFLWVSLVLHMLPHSPTASDNAFQNHLTNLPDGITDVYTRMLNQVPYRSRSQAKDMLEIIVAARRPLSLEQLGQCFRISSDHRSLADLQYQPNFTRTVHQLCRNFVRIINNRCYLVHQSAKDYLLSATPGDRKKHDAPPLWFHTTAAQATAALAMRCIWFLNLEDFGAAILVSRIANARRHSLVIKSSNLFRGTYVVPLPDALDEVLQELYKQQAFLHYAIHYWADHFREAEIFETATGKETVLQLYSRNLTVRAHWLMKVFRLSEAQVKRVVYWVPPSLYCAYNGHMTIIADLLEDRDHDNEPLTQLGYSTLHMAIAGKHLSMVDWLLHSNADIEAKDSFGRTPLHVAARRNDTKILRLLLDHGANIAAQDNDGKTPQQHAEVRGRHSHADMLRDHGKAADTPVNEWVQSMASLHMICPSPEVVEMCNQLEEWMDPSDRKPEFPFHRQFTQLSSMRTIRLRRPSNSASGTVTIMSRHLLGSNNSSSNSTVDSDERISLSISFSHSHRSYGHPPASSTEDNWDNMTNLTPEFSRETSGCSTANTQLTSMLGAQTSTPDLQGKRSRSALRQRSHETQNVASD